MPCVAPRINACANPPPARHSPGLLTVQAVASCFRYALQWCCVFGLLTVYLCIQFLLDVSAGFARVMIACASSLSIQSFTGPRLRAWLHWARRQWELRPASRLHRWRPWVHRSSNLRVQPHVSQRGCWWGRCFGSHLRRRNTLRLQRLRPRRNARLLDLLGDMLPWLAGSLADLARWVQPCF